MGNTGRLAHLSALFEKYRFSKITVSYKPMVAITTPGLMFVAFDNDPEDSLQHMSGPALVSALQGLGDKALIFEVFAEASLTVSGKDFFSQLLYVDQEKNLDRWAQAGRLIWGCISPFPTSVNAGMLAAIATLTLEIPTTPEASHIVGNWANWRTTNITGSTPWGTNLTPNGNSVLPVRLATNMPINPLPSPQVISTLIFDKPGVYFVTWYQTVTAPSSGTITPYNCSFATDPGGFSSNPKIFHPSGENIGWALINVPGADAPSFITYTNGGTHTSSNNNSLSVFMTSMPPVPLNAVDVATQAINSAVDRRIAELTKRLTDVKIKPAPAVPSASTEGTAVIHSYNGLDEAVTFEQNTTQELPVETIQLDPARYDSESDLPDWVRTSADVHPIDKGTHIDN